jgi:hypothetical protein
LSLKTTSQRLVGAIGRLPFVTTIAWHPSVHWLPAVASTQLTRRFARMLPYAANERGYGPDLEDPIVIWQGGVAPPPSGPADARIVVRAGRRVILAEP